MRKQILFVLPIIITVTALYTSCNNSTDDQSPKQQKEIVYLNQGWTANDRAEFYWAPQGSALLSYDIYMALKDPATNIAINAASTTDQFGFLREYNNHPKNPDGLPIGIARSEVKEGPFKGDYIGLTCAACHTNEIEYNGKFIRIDGGNSTAIQLTPWLKLVSASLDHAQSNKEAFQELLATISKTKKVDEKDLRKRLDEDAEFVKNWLNKGLFSKNEAGPGRADAFGGINNAFLGIHTEIWENIKATNAPVKPPFLWNSSHSAWVEWSGVSNNPLQRNYSEALGVFARYDLTPKADPKNLDITTVDARWLFKIEQMIRKLAPPQWPEDIFGKIDQAKAARGAILFQQNCAKCHSTYPHRWSDELAMGKRMIENTIVPQHKIGTDPENLNSAALDTNAIVFTKHLKSFFNGKEKVTPTAFFQVAEGAMMKRSLQSQQFTEAEILDAFGYHTTEQLMYEKPPFNSYKAAPRDGSWAIGPFLHNGSVPTIYELLSPAKERTTTFYTNTVFDPVNVGLCLGAKSGKFLLDTRLEGNSNAGHSFENGKGPGIIGRLFTKEERYEIIEYLKSIPTSPAQVTPYGGPANPVIAKKDSTWIKNQKQK
jgi:hypothetical protein